MKCPFCKNELVKGLEKKYESIADHVINPNAISYPLRSTFICGNTNCNFSVNSFWDEYGTFYSNNHYPYSNITSALGSWYRKHDVKCKIAEKFYWLTKIIFKWQFNGWYFRAHSIAEFCVKHNILFGYEL